VPFTSSYTSDRQPRFAAGLAAAYDAAMNDKPKGEGEFADEGWSEVDDDLPGELAAPAKQPAGTAITIERFQDGVTIQVPPAGLWKGTRGLFAFAVLWIGFMAPFTLCMGGAILGGQQVQKGNEAVWVLPLLLSVFWSVGIILLLVALNMGKRRAALAVTGGSLMVLQTGLFGTKQRAWGPGEVDSIRAAPSGMEVNEVAILELQIDGSGGKFRLLAGRTDAELERIARELRRALRIRRH